MCRPTDPIWKVRSPVKQSFFFFRGLITAIEHCKSSRSKSKLTEQEIIQSLIWRGGESLKCHNRSRLYIIHFNFTIWITSHLATEITMWLFFPADINLPILAYSTQSHLWCNNYCLNKHHTSSTQGIKITPSSVNILLEPTKDQQYKQSLLQTFISSNPSPTSNWLFIFSLWPKWFLQGVQIKLCKYKLRHGPSP